MNELKDMITVLEEKKTEILLLNYDLRYEKGRAEFYMNLYDELMAKFIKATTELTYHERKEADLLEEIKQLKLQSI